MDTLPVAVHNHATTPRVTHAELARFEAVLDAADAACEAAAQSHHLRSAPAPPDDRTAQSNLQVMMATVHALCGGAGGAPPPPNATHKQLIKWTTDSINESRRTAVRAVAQHNLAPGMQPEQVAVAMELMQRLNGVLGGGAG